MEELLKVLKRKGIEKFEIYISETEAEPVVFQQNELQSLEVKRERGIGLRIIKNGRIGFSSTTYLKDPEELVEYAIESSRYGEEVDFDFPEGNSKFASLSIYNPEGWELDERIKLGEKILKEIASFGDIQTDIEMTFAKQKIHILNSSGLDVKYEKTLYNLTIEGMTVLSSGITWIYENSVSTGSLQDAETLLERIKTKLSYAEKVYPIKSGYHPVIIAPYVSRSVLSAIFLGINGKNVEKGISPLQSKLGKKIVNNLTLIDDPHMSEMMGARPFDDEGVETEKRYIVKDGVLQTFIFDLMTASKLKENPTGHAKRNYDSPPMPSLNNVVVEGGNKTLEELIKNIDYGLIVYSDIGGGQSNLLAGDFSLNVGLGFVIEKGEIKGRVKDTMISGNFYQSFKEEVIFSRETEVFFNMKVPYMVLGGIRVTSKEK